VGVRLINNLGLKALELVPGAGLEPTRIAPADFKSDTSISIAYHAYHVKSFLYLFTYWSLPMFHLTKIGMANS